MGIDYGHGQTNIDPETGIRYGIIPMNAINQDCIGDFEPDSTVYCPKCGHAMEDVPEEMICPKCQHEAETEADFYPEYSEAPSFYKKDGYELMLATDGDIWVMKSPFKTKAGFCSPCAPGAVYLTDRADDAYGYCLGNDWFDDERAPYVVEPVK